MKVTVDGDRCRGHGMCLTPVSEVFSMTDGGYAVADPEEVPTGWRTPRKRPSSTVPNKQSSKPTEPRRRCRQSTEEISVPKGYIVITEDVKDPAGMTSTPSSPARRWRARRSRFDQRPRCLR